MEPPVLSDKTLYPSDEIIFSHLGKSKAIWITFFEQLHSNYPELTEEWRYYNDGKSWLMKVQRKSKTIFWLSLFKKSFRITFYFTEKAEPAILKSSIPDELKESFINGKWYNKIRGLTVFFQKKKDIEYAKELITIKLSIK